LKAALFLDLDAEHPVFVEGMVAALAGCSTLNCRTPPAPAANFTTIRDADYYRQQAEEANAAIHNGFAPDCLRRPLDALHAQPRRHLAVADEDDANIGWVRSF